MVTKKPIKKKKKKSLPLRIIKTTIITFFSIFLLMAVAACGVTLAIIKTAPKLDINAVLTLNQPSTLYDGKDEYMDDVLTDEKRTVISIKDMPIELQNAFISIEDERFRTHPGIDIKRIFGAAYIDVKSKITGSNVLHGASTLTQQLVRNTILTDEVSFKRKIQEAYLAVELERYLSKDQILEAYMNTIFLGGNAHGVESAANQYFNKKANQLTLLECAFIAGIPQNPSRTYANVEIAKKAGDNPDDAAKKSVDFYENRTATVLGKMYETGHITKDQYDKAIEELRDKKLVFSSQAVTSNRMNYEWFALPAIEQVKKDLKAQYKYSDTEINSLLMYGGLKIYTTMDKNLQDSAQKVLDDDSNFGITSKKDKQGIIQPQAAVTIMDYHKGEVKAIIGGRGVNPPRSYNRAAFNGSKEFLRPTGSSIKPLSVYSPAIDTKQLTAASIVEDSPLSYDLQMKYGDKRTNTPYNPRNYDTDGFSGDVTVRTAIKRSINLVAIKIEDKIGLDTGKAYAKKFGITNILEKPNSAGQYDGIAAMALGELTNGTNPLTMTAAYGVFGNNGLLTEPRLYRKVVDKTGKTILETKINTSKVLTPQSAYVMYDLLKGPTSDYGTAPNARFGDIPVAGKTGTSGDKKNFWFCGLTPYYSGAVWIGDDIPTSHYDIYSSTSSGIWSKIMKEAHKGLTYTDIQQPSGVTRVDVCSVSGKIATDACYNDSQGLTPYSELFIDDTVPTAICTYHSSTPVHTETNDAANNNSDNKATTGDKSNTNDNSKATTSSPKSDLDTPAPSVNTPNNPNNNSAPGSTNSTKNNTNTQQPAANDKKKN